MQTELSLLSCKQDYRSWSNMPSYVLFFQELMHFLLLQMVVCLIFGVKNLGQKAARALKMPVTTSFFQRLGKQTDSQLHCRVKCDVIVGVTIAHSQKRHVFAWSTYIMIFCADMLLHAISCKPKIGTMAIFWSTPRGILCTLTLDSFWRSHLAAILGSSRQPSSSVMR